MNGAGYGASQARASHWIRLNHQERIPKRWVAFDTEAISVRSNGDEIQSWSMGAAVRWRWGLKRGDRAERATFASSGELWQWVTSFCRPDMRCVAIAHNLGYDVRISDALKHLPKLGWSLEWCNLDRNVSAMTWRGEQGTLVLCDLWTWLPVPLATIGPDFGLPKLKMPSKAAPRLAWEQYCTRDAEIVYRAKSDILHYVESEHLGNWQPTGAGMAYSTWRHKYMTHKVLVHDDTDALDAERKAMHTGRAEAWRHGKVEGAQWTEVDMRNAYVTIAAECELPQKLKFRVGAITNEQYARLNELYSILALVRVDIRSPVVPYHDGSRTLWPVGTFTTWLWDNEIREAIYEGATVKVLSAYVYTRGPILSEWAHFILSALHDDRESTSPVVRTWLKHCSRALIGRLSLRCPQWELFGGNPDHLTGITFDTDLDSGETRRFMHVGDKTLIETARTEGRDSLPQITGWIMAECRVRLWRAMKAAGLDEIAHVDTDSILVSSAGLKRLRAHWAESGEQPWQVKGTYRRLVVYGPRNYRAGRTRKVAGVPRKARELLPNVFEGEQWHSLGSDLGQLRAASVTISPATWELTQRDPRRGDSPGVSGRTVAYEVAAPSSVAASSSGKAGIGP